MNNNNLFRLIPSVDELLESEGMALLTEKFGRELVKTELKVCLDNLRKNILSGKSDKSTLKNEITKIDNTVKIAIEKTLSPSLKRLVNATGIIVHTNMGRAPLSDKVFENFRQTAFGYNNLEFNIHTGKRGSRSDHFEKLLKKLFPVEGALAVNNNAAAVLLVLNTLAEGKEVICSRGEMIEIGGSFRIPDVIRKSGCVLKEIGTTNKTKPSDYRNAINDNTGAILKVHPSNYRVVGFTEETSVAEAVEIGNKAGIPVYYDMGSGNMLDLDFLKERTIKEELLNKPDILSFSGDKLLGGPQSGIIVGKNQYMKSVKQNPLSRALRVDKLVIAALWGTLDSFLRGKFREIPVLRMLLTTKEEIKIRSELFIKKATTALSGYHFELIDSASKVGGGAAPEKELETFVVSIAKENLSPNAVTTGLRKNDPPIIARIQDDKVLIDLRTVMAEEEDIIIQALKSF